MVSTSARPQSHCGVSVTDSLRSGGAEVSAEVIQVETLQRERTDEQYYGRQTAAEINDRVCSSSCKNRRQKVALCYAASRHSVLRAAGGSQARLVVNLTADVTREFSWNTKQVFLFLTVDYSSAARSVNQLVMWSRIVLSKARFL